MQGKRVAAEFEFPVNGIEIVFFPGKIYFEIFG